MNKDKCEGCVCSDCFWYYDFLCECLEAPDAFVMPDMPAINCRYYRPPVFPRERQTFPGTPPGANQGGGEYTVKGVRNG